MRNCFFACASTFLAFLLLLPSPRLVAGPLQHAEVHKIVNDVRVVEPRQARARPAKVRDVIKDDLAVRTGVQSRAELLFQDSTLTRLGAETMFSFKTGSRNMTLDRGTMLLQVPKGVGGAKIHTAAVTAAITGTTIMMENVPGKHVKVVVLEGSLRLSINGRLGESVVLHPGKMVIVGAKDRVMPKPVTVDLRKMVKTAALIDPNKFRGTAKIKVDALPSIGLIEKEIALQTLAKGGAKLAETNLLIEGDGTDVVVATKETMAAIEAATDPTGAVVVAKTQDDRSRATPTTSVASVDTRAKVPEIKEPHPSKRDPAVEKPDTGTPTRPTTPGRTTVDPLTPIAPPTVVTVDPPTTPVTGTYTDTAPATTDVTVTTDIVAGDVSLGSGTNDVTVDGTITADNLTVDADTTAQFEDTVQANTLTISGDTLVFAEPVGAVSINLDAQLVKAVSLNASSSISITGRLQPIVSTDLLVRAPSISISGGINADGVGNSLLPLLSGAPGAGGTVVIESDSVLIDNTAGGINGISANGGDATLTSLTGGGAGGAVYIGTETRPIVGDVTIRKDITAINGAPATFLQSGGAGGKVSVVANGTIEVQAKIRVSDSNSKSGGHVRLDSRKTSGQAINFSNSSEIASLLSSGAPGPGGKVEFVSAGGDITVDNSTARADGGTVELRNTGAGNIVLNNATLRGDVVKANVLGPNGQLIIGGGSIDANSAIKLYASGTNGTVLFRDNATLNGSSVKTIAGNTVTINDGKVVTVNGTRAANVFTNNPNYTGSGGNGSTTGKFGGKGAVTKPFANRPAY